MKLRPIVLASLLAAPALCADSALLDLLPPGATFVLGVRVRNLAESPLGRSLAAEARQAGAQWAQTFQMVGFDPFGDVDELVVAAVGSGKNPPGLLAVRGRFAGPRARAAGTAYRGVVVSGKRESSTAFLDDSLMVAGDAAMVRAAIDRRGRAGGGELRAKALELGGRYDVYGCGVAPAGTLPETGPGAAMKGIDRFQFGLSVARGLDLAAELHARSAQDAQALAQMIAMATAMMGQQKGAEDLARGLDVKVEGESVRIALSVPEQALAQAVKARMAGGPAMRARPAVATGAAAEPAPAPAAPKRDPRFAPDTALIVTGAESDGGSVIFSYPKK